MSNVIEFPNKGYNVGVAEALRACIKFSGNEGVIDRNGEARLLETVDTIEALFFSMTEEEEHDGMEF